VEGRPETLDQLLSCYEEGPHKKNRDPGAAVARIKRVYASLLPQLLDKVTEESVAKLHAVRKRAGKSDATIARDFTALHGVFTWALAPSRRYLSAMPFTELKPDGKAGRKIVRYLKADERERLFAALSARDREIREARERTISGNRKQHADLRPIPAYGYADYLEPLVRIALNTACRKGELLALRWSSVDLDAGHFVIEKRSGKGSNKTDEQRPVLLNDVALGVLKQWHKQSGGQGKVFDVTSPKRAWAALLKRAKVEQFRFHDLRHDAASQLVMSGANIYDVSKILGHASVKTTERYAHLSADHMRAALGKLDAINAPTAEQQSKVVDLWGRKRR
jgi:integrase